MHRRIKGLRSTGYYIIHGHTLAFFDEHQSALFAQCENAEEMLRSQECTLHKLPSINYTVYSIIYRLSVYMHSGVHNGQ